jgi:hypothetical protein
MILPTKYIPVRQSLLGTGAVILSNINKPITVSSLWEKVREIPEIKTFERFIMSLDLLYILGAIRIREGLLEKCH